MKNGEILRRLVIYSIKEMSSEYKSIDVMCLLHRLKKDEAQFDWSLGLVYAVMDDLSDKRYVKRKKKNPSKYKISKKFPIFETYG